MDLLALGQALTDAGGWAAFMALAVAVLVGLWRRWWVPGFWYAALEVEVKELRRTVARLTVARARDGRRRRSDAP